MNALICALLLAVVVLQSAQSTPPGGSIEGVVLKSGTVLEQVLPNARLELTQGPGTPLIARTDAGGRFLFSNLSPGRYRLAVTRDGFIRQQYGQRTSNAAGAPIVVTAGRPVRDIVFRLEPASTAAGSVQDEFGEPIANAIVQALRRSYDIRGNRTLTVAASAVTDDRGVYRILWLDPGEYFFFVNSMAPPPPGSENSTQSPRRGVVPTYFPGVTEPAAARPLRVQIGRELEGINFRLRRAALIPVRGNVTSGINGRAMVASIALTPPLEDPNLTQYRTQSSMQGAFGFAEGVPPGAYILSGRGSSAEPLIGYQRVTIPAVLVPFDYPAHLSLNPGIRIDGKFFVDSGSPVDLGRTRVSLISEDPGFPSPADVTPRPNGEFSLTGALPGQYFLNVSGLPEDIYIKAAVSGTRDVLEMSLNVQRESPVPLQILLGSDGGRISITVFDRENRSYPDARVVLVPDAGRRHRPDQFRAATADENGQVTIRGIPPGNYKLFAWESIEPNAYLNSDVLRAYEDLGVPVRVTPGENTPVAVRSIPAEP